MSQRNSSGLALVITLAFVVMITVLVVGMAVSMRSDRAAASSYLERTRAELIAHSAVDKVMATLRKHTADVQFWRNEQNLTTGTLGKVQRERYWISRPGELWVGAETDDASSTNVDQRFVLQPQPVPLYSGIGVPSTVGPVFDPPNLNISTFNDPAHHLITDLPDSKDPSTAVQMQLAWVYLRQDGTTETSQTPDLTSKTNPIVGRYAYWTDDESSKINYNIAWGRNAANTHAGAHPSKIDLTALPSLDESKANALRSFILAGNTNLLGSSLMPSFPLPPAFHYFNSPEDARRIGGSGAARDQELSEALKANQFDLTHYNHDPDTTFFGDDRILLTTNRNLVPHTVQRDANGNPIKDPVTGKNKIVYLRKFLDLLRDDLPTDCLYPAGGYGALDVNRYPKDRSGNPQVGELDPGNIYHHFAGQIDFTAGYKTRRLPHNDSDYINAYGYPYPHRGLGISFEGALSTPGKNALGWYDYPNKFDSRLREIMNYVSRTDWPINSQNKSFKDKFYPGTPNWTLSLESWDPTKPLNAPDNSGRMAQVVMNIIGYVCAKESAGVRGALPLDPSKYAAPPWPWPASDVNHTDNSEMPTVDKRPDNGGPDYKAPVGLTGIFRYGYGENGHGPDSVTKRFSYDYVYARQDGSAYESPGRMPLLTEMGMWMEWPAKTFTATDLASIPQTANATTLSKYRYLMRAEFYLPKRYGIKAINLVPDPSICPADGSLGWFVRFTDIESNQSGKNGRYLPTKPEVPIYYYHVDSTGARRLKPTRKGSVTPMRIFGGDGTDARPIDIIGGTKQDGTGKGTWLVAGNYVTIEKEFFADQTTGTNAIPYSFRQEIGMASGLYVGRSVGPEPAKCELLADYTNWDRVNLGAPYTNNTTSGPGFNNYTYGFSHPIGDSGCQYWINISAKPPLPPPNSVQPKYATATSDDGMYFVSNPDNMRTIEIDDPRTGQSANNWRFSSGISGKRNTFGFQNSICSLGNTSTTTPQQDTDSSGKITDASFYMPPPAGTTYTDPDGVVYDNTVGRVTSLAELGYIHTGIDGNAKAPPGGQDCTTPWRTLRLQSNNDSADVLPDWAFLDLFEVPRINSTRRVPNTAYPIIEDSISDPTSEFYTPYGTNLRGRVNLNAEPNPFPMDRMGASRALVTGIERTPGSPGTRLTSSQVETIAKNIRGKILASRGKVYGRPEVYDSPGEICEIAGIADSGEQSEDTLRQISSLTTARGGVFAVHTIGQALKQTADGKLKVTAEQRQQAIVERYVDDRGTLIDPNEALPVDERVQRAKQDDIPRIRTVYCRNLNP